MRFLLILFLTIATNFISFAVPKLTFLSYYESSSSLPIVRTDGKGNIYVITSSPIGLMVRAFDKNKNLIWEKSITPNRNTLQTILKSKGADFGGKIDIRTLGLGTTGTDLTKTYTTSIGHSCGINNSLTFQYQPDDAVLLRDAKISGGYLFILGRTCNPNFPVSSTGKQMSYIYYYKNGNTFFEKDFEFHKEIILFKLSLKDGSIAYSSYYGASLDEEPEALDIDQNGNIFITGYTNTPLRIKDNYPVSTYQVWDIPEYPPLKLQYSAPKLTSAPNNSQCSHKSYINPFVLKLTNTTYSLEKIHIFGSYCIDKAYDITVDKKGDVYVAGETFAGGYHDFIHFDIGVITPARSLPNSSTSYTSGQDVFVVRFNNNLIPISARITGSNGKDDVFGGIDTDNNGNIYLVGNATIGDFWTVNNKFQHNVSSGGCYVVKFNPSSTNIAFSTYIDSKVGVTSQSGGQCENMQVSPDGKIYIVGTTNIPNTNGGDAFAYIMDGSNQNTVHIEKISGSGYDDASSIDIDSIGNAYIFGSTQSQDLTEINPLQGFNTIDTQNGNTFLAKLSFKEKLDVSMDKQFPGQGTITSSPKGINCSNISGSNANSCSATYNVGTQITLTATPAKGSTFVEWNPNSDCSSCGTNQKCNITINNYTNCIAVFDAPTGSGGGSGNINRPPNKPTLTADKTKGQPPLGVNFTCTTTDPDYDKITSYEWTILDFSKGSAPTIKTTTTNKLTYQFKTDGLYEVRCSATDSNGNQSVESNPINVSVITSSSSSSNAPPSIIMFSPDTPSGYAHLTITFNWDVVDPDKDPVSCTLDIDNDGKADYTINDCINTRKQSHTYTSNGIYTAKLTAIDSKNNKTEKTVNIEVYYKIKTNNGKDIKVVARNATIDNAKILDSNNILFPPANTKALYVVSFKATLKQGKTTANVKIKLPSVIPSNAKIYKLVNNQKYIDITKKVSIINGDTIEFAVQDNSSYDTNPAQGVIEDPVVIAEDVSSNNNSGNVGGGSGSNNSSGNNSGGKNNSANNILNGGGCNFGENSSLFMSMLILAVIYIRRRLYS